MSILENFPRTCDIKIKLYDLAGNYNDSNIGYLCTNLIYSNDMLIYIPEWLRDTWTNSGVDLMDSIIRMYRRKWLPPTHKESMYYTQLCKLHERSQEYELLIHECKISRYIELAKTKRDAIEVEIINLLAVHEKRIADLQIKNLSKFYDSIGGYKWPISNNESVLYKLYIEHL